MYIAFGFWTDLWELSPPFVPSKNNQAGSSTYNSPPLFEAILSGGYIMGAGGGCTLKYTSSLHFSRPYPP